MEFIEKVREGYAPFGPYQTWYLFETYPIVRGCRSPLETVEKVRSAE